MQNTPSLSAESLIAWHPDQITTEIFGEVVAMSVARGLYIGLDDIASNIWKRLEHPQTIGALCTQLSHEFRGDSRQIENDVTELLTALQGMGLIQTRNAATV